MNDMTLRAMVDRLRASGAGPWECLEVMAESIDIIGALLVETPTGSKMVDEQRLQRIVDEVTRESGWYKALHGEGADDGGTQPVEVPPPHVPQQGAAAQPGP